MKKKQKKKKAVEILKKHSWFAIPMSDPVPFPILHEGGSKAGYSKETFIQKGHRGLQERGRVKLCYIMWKLCPTLEKTAF